VDLLGGILVAHGPRSARFFDQGWGDEQVLTGFDLPLGAVPAAEITWGEPTAEGLLVRRAGTFISPHADRLPPASRQAVVTSFEPAGGTERLAVLMAAWNDHDATGRIDIARRLVEGHGIGAWILENPYYGARRPHEGQTIRTVADFVAMGSAAIAEGRALLATIRATGRTPGISGYSMGGNVAALIAASMPFPVAAAPLAAAHSPAPVYLDGVLRGGIVWEALGGEDTAAPRLRELLLRADVCAFPAAAHVASAVLVAARDDAYVPPAAVEAIHRHWPGSELWTLPGGHATVWWFRRRRLAAAVRRAFERLTGADRP